MSAGSPPSDLLEILRCPASGERLVQGPNDLVAALNERIAAQGGSKLRNGAGAEIAARVDGALIRADGKALYLVRDTIPILLVDEAVALPLI